MNFVRPRKIPELGTDSAAAIDTGHGGEPGTANKDRGRFRTNTSAHQTLRLQIPGHMIESVLCICCIGDKISDLERFSPSGSFAAPRSDVSGLAGGVLRGDAGFLDNSQISFRNRTILKREERSYDPLPCCRLARPSHRRMSSIGQFSKSPRRPETCLSLDRPTAACNSHRQRQLFSKEPI